MRKEESQGEREKEERCRWTEGEDEKDNLFQARSAEGEGSREYSLASRGKKTNLGVDQR